MILANWFYDYIWIFILIILLMLIFGIAFCLFLMFRRRVRHQVKELRKKFTVIHELLNGDCKNMITRLEFISAKNPHYVGIHDQFQTRFNSTIASLDIPCDQAVGSLETLVKEKIYRNIKDIIESTKINVIDYGRSVKKISDDLSELLKTDDDCRSDSLSVKESFRRLKNEYNNHITELRGLEETFNLVFNEIESELGRYSDLVDSANYTAANAVIDSIKQIIDAIQVSMIYLPLLNTLIKVVLPKRLFELTRKYNEMIENKYPLHHLHYNTTVDKIESQIGELENRLNSFVTDGIKEEIDEITDLVDNLFQAFEVEKEAKIQFENEQTHTSDDTYELEKEFTKLKRSLPEYKEIYIINDSYIEQINLIQEDISRMSSIKRDLDSFVHSSTKQPYSILLRKMKDLQVEMNKITKTLSDFHDYLFSLKDDTERAYASIRTNYVKLMEAKYTLRSLNVSALNDQLHLGFVKAMTFLSDENEILSNTPLDVVSLNPLIAASDIHIANLLSEVKEQYDLALRAENSIVYGNLIRDSYAEVDRALQVAERSFNEADFTRAFNEALGAIKKMRPELYN